MNSIARSSMLLWSLSTMVSANIFRDDNGVLTDSSYLKDTRIIGGTVAMDGRYPYVVSLKAGSDHVCGGSLIAKDTVLTAAHCLGGFVTIAAVGNNVLGMGEEVAVKSEVVYPDYDSVTDQNDFGLIFLDGSVTLDVPLLRLNDDSSLPEIGSTNYVMGWGDTDASDATLSLPNELMIVGLPVISNADCDNSSKGGDSYAGLIFDNMICTSSVGEDACQGDSGGPLIIRGDDPESDLQVGIVSWGIGCAYLPGVFSRVSTGYSWIQETVCGTSTDPPGILCGSTETANPTADPTPRPSENPTAEPTENPTAEPTDHPTDSPTLSPSLSPTTAEPTLSPTISRSPTSSPSASFSPTKLPSVFPTISTQPTMFPSISSSPSTSPSSIPTNSQLPTLSAEPTYFPSSIPSQSPSISISPTTKPTTSPSFRPSTSPTDTFSPSLSSRPTKSAIPTVDKASRGIPSDSLLFSDTSVLLDDDELDKSSSVDRMGHSRIVAIGCVLSSISIMFITWMDM